MLETLFAADGAALLWIQEALRCTVLDPFFQFYTKLGDVGMLWIVLSLLMLCTKRTRRAGLLGLCAIVVGFLCTNVALKHLFSRTRPWLVVTGLVPLVAEHDPNSFPSGHTCAAFAAALTWRHTLPRRWMRNTGLVLAVLMGFSRLYVGVHFPTDVLVGGAVGALCALLVLWICARWKGRSPLR